MTDHMREQALKEFDNFEKLEITEVNKRNDHSPIESECMLLGGSTMDSSIE